MKCNEFEKIVNEYVDGELKQSIDIEEHLYSCDACKALYEETLEIKAMLSGLDMIELPDDFEDTLHDKLVEVSKEMKRNEKVTPIRKWNRQLKVAGSIAAVMLLSVLAARTFPMMGSDNDSAMNESFEMNTESIAVMDSAEETTENFYASDDAEVESADMESADMDVSENTMMTSVAPEVAFSKALTLRMPTQVYVSKGRTFFLKKTSLESIDALIEPIDIKSLEILPDQYQFYIRTNQLDNFIDNLRNQFTITDELLLDYSYELENFYNEYEMLKEQIGNLKGDYDLTTDGEQKDELKVQIDAQVSELSSYEIDFNEIERFKNYTQIIIILDEE